MKFVVIISLFTITISTTTADRDSSGASTDYYLKNFLVNRSGIQRGVEEGAVFSDSVISIHQNQHRRVRRMLGRATQCIDELKKFCQNFTHGGISKKFCLVVPVKRCTALD